MNQPQSMIIKNRIEIANSALEKSKKEIPSNIKFFMNIGHQPYQGTQTFTAIEPILQNDPFIHDIIIISDRQLHNFPNKLIIHHKQIPVNFILSAVHEETNRNLKILPPPSYTIIGEKAKIQMQIDDVHKQKL